MDFVLFQSSNDGTKGLTTDAELEGWITTDIDKIIECGVANTSETIKINICYIGLFFDFSNSFYCCNDYLFNV